MTKAEAEEVVEMITQAFGWKGVVEGGDGRTFTALFRSKEREGAFVFTGDKLLKFAMLTRGRIVIFANDFQMTETIAIS